jgi:murein DD-endopeptidase MepM/ murein hydrolase activator NlpD
MPRPKKREQLPDDRPPIDDPAGPVVPGLPGPDVGGNVPPLVAVARPITPATPVRQIGPLPIATWRGVLETAGSPMLAELDAIVDACGAHGAMCLAQAYKESSLGKDATARRTRNPYGIMEFGDRPCEPVLNGQLCLRKFASWADATRTYAAIVADADPPYDPEGITLEEYLATYVGGPGCRQSRGQACANGETWVPGGGRDAGSINLYLWQTIDRINGWRATTPGEPPNPPPPRRDPIEIIVGGPVPPISYGWRADAGLHYYRYGHGTNRETEHTGLDIPLECGALLYTPFAGVVDCVGAAGTARWGQGCGAYADVDGGGAGNVTILLDAQYQGSPVKLTLGHCRQAFVRPGDRVSAGQRVATVGSMNGCHVHVETSVQRNGTYWLVDPRLALGGSATGGYPPRLPFTEPARTITVTPRPGAKIYQRADPASPEVSEPFAAGETFESGILTLGTDGEWWFVGTRHGRVRVADVTSPRVRIG